MPPLSHFFIPFTPIDFSWLFSTNLFNSFKMIIRPALISTLLLAVLIFVCTTSPTKRSSDVEQIVKSASDDNEYRAVTLSNEIRCVLVSDTSTEIAAVQLQVG